MFLSYTRIQNHARSIRCISAMKFRHHVSTLDIASQTRCYHRSTLHLCLSPQPSHRSAVESRSEEGCRGTTHTFSGGGIAAPFHSLCARCPSAVGSERRVPGGGERKNKRREGSRPPLVQACRVHHHCTMAFCRNCFLPHSHK